MKYMLDTNICIYTIKRKPGQKFIGNKNSFPLVQMIVKPNNSSYCYVCTAIVRGHKIHYTEIITL